jgi:hypothetical protein
VTGDTIRPGEAFGDSHAHSGMVDGYRWPDAPQPRNSANQYLVPDPSVATESHCPAMMDKSCNGTSRRSDLLLRNTAGKFRRAARRDTRCANWRARSEIGSPVGVSVLCPGPMHTEIHKSCRHWSGRFGPRPEVEDPPGIAAWRRDAATMVESGLDPAVIATAVEQAIVGNQFWILTHPEYADALLARYNGVVKGGRSAIAGPGVTASGRSAACSTEKARHSNVLLKSAGEYLFAQRVVRPTRRIALSHDRHDLAIHVTGAVIGGKPRAELH